MSAPRIAVALVAAAGALTTSLAPTSEKPLRPAIGREAAPVPASGARLSAPESPSPAPWPPAFAALGPATVEARLERTASGAQRLVVEERGTFVHVRYREVASGGPDWAAIELRAGDKAPPADVAVWESTDPHTLLTKRGLVTFSLQGGAAPAATETAPPALGPRSASGIRTCQSHEDGASGFAVVCRVGEGTSAVRAIRPAGQKPLAGAWVWDVPRSVKAADPKSRAARFVRVDLPLSPGGAEGGAIAYAHGGKGVVLLAEATWPSRAEPAALVFTESSRSQPVSPFFDWRPSRGVSRP